MRRELVRIAPIKAANVISLLYAILFGAMALLFLPFFAFLPLQDQQGNSVSAAPILTMILLYPVLGAVTGWIGVATMASLYNFIARRIGGIQVEVSGGPEGASTA